MAEQGTRPRTRRTVQVVDNSHVARRVGERIRQARIRAGMTQAQVASGRYTSAYISALERGLAKPSMAALTFLSERLGTPITDLVAAERPVADRLEADLLLAAGRHAEALDRYDALLASAGDDRRLRADLQRRRAEALCRIGAGQQAISPAAEAATALADLGLPVEAAWARYWLAFAHYQADNPAEARGVLQELLAADRGGLQVAPDFRFRLLTALGNVEAWDGEWNRAVTYMEEARSHADAVTLHQRAAFLSGLALQYRQIGDLEASIRVGHESLALYQVAEAAREEAALEINLGLAFVQLGNLRQAAGHLDRSRELAAPFDDVRLDADITEAEAKLALARGDREGAHERARRAIALAQGGASYLAAVGAHLTLARIARSEDDPGAAEAEYKAASRMLAEHGAGPRLRDVYGEWAEARAARGDHAGANELYARALGRASEVPAGR